MIHAALSRISRFNLCLSEGPTTNLLARYAKIVITNPGGRILLKLADEIGVERSSGTSPRIESWIIQKLIIQK